MTPCMGSSKEKPPRWSTEDLFQFVFVVAVRLSDFDPRDPRELAHFGNLIFVAHRKNVLSGSKRIDLFVFGFSVGPLLVLGLERVTFIFLWP